MQIYIHGVSYVYIKTINGKNIRQESEISSIILTSVFGQIYCPCEGGPWSSSDLKLEQHCHNDCCIHFKAAAISI